MHRQLLEVGTPRVDQVSQDLTAMDNPWPGPVAEAQGPQRCRIGCKRDFFCFC